MNTALFLLRAIQLGIRIEDLQYLTVGDVFDLATESANDHATWKTMATQEDFDKF